MDPRWISDHLAKKVEGLSERAGNPMTLCRRGENAPGEASAISWRFLPTLKHLEACAHRVPEKQVPGLCRIWLQISWSTRDGIRPSLERAGKAENQRSLLALVYPLCAGQVPPPLQGERPPRGQGPVLETRLGTKIPRPSTGLLKVFLRRPHSVSLLHWGLGEVMGCVKGVSAQGGQRCSPSRACPRAERSWRWWRRPETAEGAAGLSEPPRAPLTVIHAAAEATLVPPPSFDELHERAHVGFAPVASDWSSLAMVYQVEGRLQEASRSKITWARGLQVSSEVLQL